MHILGSRTPNCPWGQCSGFTIHQQTDDDEDGQYDSGTLNDGRTGYIIIDRIRYMIDPLLYTKIEIYSRSSIDGCCVR